MTIAPRDILDFWFGPGGNAREIAARQSPLWFGKSAVNDQRVNARFSDTLVTAAAGRLDGWAATPHGRLALIIVLDQFPHHIHRGGAKSFATDPQALAHALAALESGEDVQLSPIERVFLYLPIEHAESVEMQDLSVALYGRLAAEASADERALFDDFLKYAHAHRDVIVRFGRYPHRNKLLGRPSTPEEIEFLKQPGSRF